MSFKILVINPGATSTKIAIFQDETLIHSENVSHKADQLSGYKTLLDQVPYREGLIHQALQNASIAVDDLSAVVGRGGMLMPVEGGTYYVDSLMLDYLKKAPRGVHASNLGAILAHDFAQQAHCDAYIVDPVATDELSPVARITGCPELERPSLFHALNHKAVAKKVAASMNRRYEDVSFIVAHLGTGISIGVHKGGRVVDVNDAMNDGTFSADRAGGLPSMELAKLCYSGKLSLADIKKKIGGNGGLFGYLQTKDLREVEARIDQGDAQAALIFDAMVYQISKDIGAMATVLEGAIDKIILTGGMAFSERLVGKIRECVEFLAPVELVPGEEEMHSLAHGTLSVLRGEERAKHYPWREVEGVWSCCFD